MIYDTVVWVVRNKQSGAWVNLGLQLKQIMEIKY